MHRVAFKSNQSWKSARPLNSAPSHWQDTPLQEVGPLSAVNSFRQAQEVGQQRGMLLHLRKWVKRVYTKRDVRLNQPKVTTMFGTG